MIIMVLKGLKQGHNTRAMAVCNVCVLSTEMLVYEFYDTLQKHYASDPVTMNLVNLGHHLWTLWALQRPMTVNRPHRQLFKHSYTHIHQPYTYTFTTHKKREILINYNNIIIRRRILNIIL